MHANPNAAQERPRPLTVPLPPAVAAALEATAAASDLIVDATASPPPATGPELLAYLIDREDLAGAAIEKVANVEECANLAELLAGAPERCPVGLPPERRTTLARLAELAGLSAEETLTRLALAVLAEWRRSPLLWTVLQPSVSWLRGYGDAQLCAEDDPDAWRRGREACPVEERHRSDSDSDNDNDSDSDSDGQRGGGTP